MAEIRVNATGAVKFYDNDDSHFVGLQAGSISSDVTFTLPTADGSNGQFMKTNGSGALSFGSVSSALDDITTGDAASTLATSAGNITIDAQGNDTDIIFKGTDGSSDTTFLTIDGSDAGTLIANHNLELGTDSSEILFGSDNEVKVIHNADKGLILKHTATADDKPVILTLQTGETDMAANDVIGKIEFQAPDEGTGTDAILVSGAIQAVAEGDHSSSSNATSLEFMTGASEAATTKIKITSAGHLVPASDNTSDLGTASLEFKDAYFDGTVTSDAGLFDTLGIVTAKDLGRGLHIRTSDTGGDCAANATDLVIERAGDNGMTFLNNNSGETFINFGDDGDNDIGQIRYHHAYNRMQLHTNAVERLRIASDGEVSINDGQVDTNGTVFKVKGAVDETTCKYYHGSTSGNQNLFVFYDGAVENCGSISINTAANTVAYNTSSDYRLKENETAITDGITRLKQLKPYRFNWKADKDGDKVDGFFAHEVSSIVPEAIFGTKDAMTTDDDGKTVINPQQIDQSKLVPLLTAAIIELEARVKTLEG
jgi:hypothetical protein